MSRDEDTSSFSVERSGGRIIINFSDRHKLHQPFVGAIVWYPVDLSYHKLLTCVYSRHRVS